MYLYLRKNLYHRVSRIEINGLAMYSLCLNLTILSRILFLFFSAWEARIDSHGRVFYIDHINRTTTWQRPNLTTRNTGCDLRRQQLDRRYQSVRRTISRPDNIDRETNSTTNGNSFESTERPSERTTDRSESEPFDITTIPPVLFLTRPDFFTVLHTNVDAMELYNRNPSLKHMISRVRRDPIVFPRYEHNRDLVALINFFADPSKELPRGYESKLDRTGKVSFRTLIYSIVHV